MSTFTAQTKHSATPTNQARGLTTPTLSIAGVYYGFGAFTYSGGQTLSPGTLPVWTSQSKHNATITNQTKH